MDFARKNHMTNESQGLPPTTSLPNIHIHPPSAENFPVIAIVLIGMFSTSFFLLSYYIFVIKCCLNYHQVGLARRFSLSRRTEEPSNMSSTRASEPRGLEEAVIRLIPVIRYNNTKGGKEFEEISSCECAVCLNEFQEDEKLRVIPNCNHLFHIDCIDVWLQNNANCPLCRSIISLTNQTIQIDHLTPTPPRPSPQNQSQNNENIEGDEDFVVIDLDNELDSREERDKALDSSRTTCPISPSSSHMNLDKKGKKLHKVTSMGDECIGIKDKKDQIFSFQPIRRSFSMDSSVDRKFYLEVQHALQQQKGHVQEAKSFEVCGENGGAKKSCFSFGSHGSRSRSSVLPVYLEP